MFNCCCFSYPKVIHSVGFFTHTRMINPQSQPLNFVFWLIASSLLVLGFSTNQKTPARYSTSPSFMVVAFPWFLYCTGWFVSPMPKSSSCSGSCGKSISELTEILCAWLTIHPNNAEYLIGTQKTIWLANQKRHVFVLAFSKVFANSVRREILGYRRLGTQGRQKSWDPDGPDVIPGCVCNLITDATDATLTKSSRNTLVFRRRHYHSIYI